MTLKLFYQDPYMYECEARVISINGFDIIVDKTVFFAFSGGQESDDGTINNIHVKLARAEGKEIVYTLDSEPDFSAGDTVKISIDSNKRCRLMRLHSATHVIWFLFKEKTGISKLIGSNVDAGKGRLDYEYRESIAQFLPQLEEEANRLFLEKIEIKSYNDAKDPAKRLWQCNEWICPCSGTHVRNTGEIGRIKLKRKNIGAGKERIEIMLD
jgi:alanyl-tRNA synthetase